jgi:putative aldouronate transport system permease protein
MPYTRQTIPLNGKLSSVKPRVKKPLWSYYWNHRYLYLMILPAFVYYIVYHYIPMYGASIAFKDFQITKGIWGSPWAGLKHFEYLMTLDKFSEVFWNTLIISLYRIIFGFPFPILVALLLNEVRRAKFKSIVQTVIYLPHFLSWVILSGIMVDILSPSSGAVNQLLQIFGVNPIFFLGDNRWFPTVLVLSEVWKDFGWGSIVYLAAILGINPALYEAAVIDGANRWKQTWHISLPGMLPVIVLMATLSLGKVLNAGFDQVFNLYSPLTYASGDIIDTLVYRIGLVDAQFSVGAAIGVFKSAISLVLVSVSYFLAYRFANYRIF